MNHSQSSVWRPTRNPRTEQAAARINAPKSWIQTIFLKVDDAKTVFDILSDSPGAADAWLPKRAYGKSPADYRELVGALPAATIQPANAIACLDVAFGKGKWRKIFTCAFEDHAEWAKARLASALLSKKQLVIALLS